MARDPSPSNRLGRTYTLAFYMGEVGSGTTAVFQETDGGIVSDGNLSLQQGAPFTLASVDDSYALNSSGVSGAAPQVTSGQLGSNGAGTIVSGAIDTNVGGTDDLGASCNGFVLCPRCNRTRDDYTYCGSTKLRRLHREPCANLHSGDSTWRAGCRIAAETVLSPLCGTG